jgi:hypothetical protein
MAFNVPNYDTSKISFGPGVVYMNNWTGGTPPGTPSGDAGNDVGAISEDGITVELTSDKRYIAQGNPRLNIFGVSQVQAVSVSFTGIEWNVTTFKRAIGSGTAATGGPNTFSWGGDPSCIELGISIKHKQINGYDLFVHVWKAVSETGFSLPFGQDEHSFEYRFNALHSSVDFGSTAITDNLIYISRATS